MTQQTVRAICLTVDSYLMFSYMATRNGVSYRAKLVVYIIVLVSIGKVMND